MFLEVAGYLLVDHLQCRWSDGIVRLQGGPGVHFRGDVFNLHILSDEPADHHYILANGGIAHNAKIIG